MKKYNFRCFLIVFCAFTMLIFSSCSTAQQKKQTDANIYSDHQALNEHEKEKTHAIVNYSLPDFSLEELVQRSLIVIQGKIVDKSDPFEVKAAGGGDPSVFTYSYIEPTKIFRGEEYINTNKLAIRVEGGESKNMIVDVEGFEGLNVGDEYLLFLHKPNIGTGYSLEDENAYWIVGIYGGVYKKHNSNLFKYDGDKGVSKENINLNNFEKRIKELNKQYPPNPDFTIDELLHNLKENLDSGWITQEEYDKEISTIYTYGELVE